MEVFYKISLKGAMGLIGIGRDNFVKYIVCPLCSSVFDYEFGFSLQDGHKFQVIALMLGCQTTLHSHKGRVVKSSNGSVTVQPYKTFPYQSITEALKNKKGIYR